MTILYEFPESFDGSLVDNPSLTVHAGTFDLQEHLQSFEFGPV